MNDIILFINLLIFSWANLSAGTPSFRVRVRNGMLEGGSMITRKGREIAAFKSIPYALPPIGTRRFKAPEPAASWTGIRSATADVPICFQAKNEVFSIDTDQPMTEDCLYLNVYTPKVNYNDSSSFTNFPVMVWIHGGGFYSGTSHSKLYSPEFLLDQDIVLVTLNYRVEAFGFLSTVDSAADGNQGLKDQAQALRWVQENIAVFGGDADGVTVFGESAGAISVHHQMMSPLAKGLFHRAISQSGTSIVPWAIQTQKAARSYAFKLGKDLNCTSDNSQELIACLQTKNAEDIIATSQGWLVKESLLLPHFKPVVERNHSAAFLTEDPIDIIRSGRAADVPWLNGVNSDEGCIAVAPLFGIYGSQVVDQIDKKFDELIPYMLGFDESCPRNKQTIVTAGIRDYYFADQRVNESTRFDLIDMDSDAYFHYGHATSIMERLKYNKNKTYFYFFGYTSDWSWASLLGDSDRDYGACHADDLQYFFPIRDVKNPKPYSAEDYDMVDTMTTLWYNFAKTGHPTPTKEELGVVWDPVESHHLEQLLIGSAWNLMMIRDYHTDTVDFWTSLPCPAGLAPQTNRL